MSSDWPQEQLTNLVTIKGGKRLPAGKSLQQEPNSHPYIRVRDVGHRDLPRSGLEYVPDDLFPPISRYIVQPNDVLLSIVGTIGALSIVDEQYNLASLTENCVKLHGLGREDALYLFYYLSSPVGQQEIHRGTVGAVQPKLPIYNIEKIAVTWPSKHMRSAIAEILGALDDRITLLRETNATLETIAQALFKSWFVDFDPVRAKQQGRAPEGMDEATAALFPDSFEESELGPVPRGWRVDVLGDELKIAYGKNLPTSQLLDSGYPVYGGNGQIGFIDKYLYETRQVLIACRGAASGKVNQSSPKAFVTNNSLVLESNESTALPFGYLKWYMLRSDLMPFVTGSAQPQVTIDNLKVFKLLIPCAEALKAFESFSSVIEERIEENDQQAQTLATLRDTLLPRLISGQLRLPEAGAKIEGVTA